MVFLHKDDDFLPYTPRRKQNLHENVHGLGKEELVESLELTVRKEVMKLEKAECFWLRIVYSSTKTLSSVFPHSSMTLPS